MDGTTITHSDAIISFDQLRTRVFVQEMLALLGWRQPGLIPFEEVRSRLRLHNKFYRGLQDVPLDQIIGSLGRSNDFTRAFLPLHNNARERWVRINELSQMGAGLPPVDLCKVGDAYFVQDGNHRVSVARANGASTIQAYVWEYETRVSLTADVDVDDLVIKQEYVNFLAHTQLDQLRSEQQIELTQAGAYRELAEHIEVHRYFLGIERRSDVSYAEAVTSWFDHVYQPAVEAIRRHNVLAVFAGRTEGDLYLWVMQHLYFLRQQYGQAVDSDIAAEDLAESFPLSPLLRAAVAVRRGIRSILDPGDPPTVVQRLLTRLEESEQVVDALDHRES